MKKIILTIILAAVLATNTIAQVTSTTGTFGTGDGTTTPDMVLKTGSAASGTARVTIAATGNVGIGTTVAPTTKLEVNGTFKAGTINTSSGSIVSSNPANGLSFTTNSAVRLAILTSGNVGIGTASPATKLDVAGTITATGLIVNGVTYMPSQWTTNATSIYSINTGNVGIGTDTPTEKFHVVGNVLSTQVSTTSGIYSSAAGSGLSLRTGTTERITVLSSGFTGIGTATPTEMLEVNGKVLSNQFSATTGNFNSTGNLSLLTNGTSRLSILNTNGNVGVGTATPESKLHVTGNVVLENGSNPTLYTGSGSGELNRYLLLSNSNGTPTPSGLKAGGVLIADNYGYANPSKNDLVVKGTVAVGTPLASNPNGYSLAVNGKIGAKDVQVERSSSTWPDYVFSTNYVLPSLATVEKYIQENNHLEGVPSAEEVKKDGHLLGEMDEVLLKKVEELTLYIIAQQKEIDALKKSLETKRKKRN